MVDPSSWRAKEVEYLIVLRSTASIIFDEAIKATYRIFTLWEIIATCLPKDVIHEKRKSAKECQWMWNMLMKEYTDVLRGTKKKADFLYFQDMDQAWKYLRKVDPDKF